MWGRRLLYALTLLAALLGQLFDVGYLFHFLFFAVLALPVLSLLVSLPAILGCRAALEPGELRVRRGGRLEWTLRLRSRTGLPLARVSCHLTAENRMTGERVRLRLPMNRVLPAGGRSLVMAADRCGLVECRAEGLRVCGCLGLLALPLPPPPPAAVLVYPVPEPPGILELPEGLGTPQPVPRGKSPSGEDYELRPYREGDALRSIHWKMSAKRDELVTRELLAEKRPLPILTFDHFGDPDTLDRVLDRLAGCSRALLKREQPHAVRWLEPKTGAVREYAVGCEEDWLRCLTAIFRDPVPPEGIRTGSLGNGGDDFFQIHITGTGESPCPEL